VEAAKLSPVEGHNGTGTDCKRKPQAGINHYLVRVCDSHTWMHTNNSVSTPLKCLQLLWVDIMNCEGPVWHPGTVAVLFNQTVQFLQQ